MRERNGGGTSSVKDWRDIGSQLDPGLNKWFSNYINPVIKELLIFLPL